MQLSGMAINNLELPSEFHVMDISVIIYTRTYAIFKVMIFVHLISLLEFFMFIIVSRKMIILIK